MFYELSQSLQHSFLIYDEEKNDFKGIWAISFELKNRVFCHLSKFEFCLLEESLVSLGRLCFTSPTVNKRKRS
jgi:hypothetical protein